MAKDGKTVLAANVPAVVDKKFLRFMRRVDQVSANPPTSRMPENSPTRSGDGHAAKSG
jgi:hypothetical protein